MGDIAPDSRSEPAARSRRPSLAGGFGRAVFAARWLLAPIYIGLLLGLVLLMVKFLQILWGLLPELLQMSGHDLVLALLGLVDLSLVANLVLIVALAGWHCFVDPMQGSHIEDMPEWLALDFSAIKLKLIGSIAVIAAIAVLEAFLHADTLNAASIAWQLAVLLAIGVVGVLLAAMDRLSHKETKE
jgi:uncharacterized protein (TIGR00645 family)